MNESSSHIGEDFDQYGARILLFSLICLQKDLLLLLIIKCLYLHFWKQKTYHYFKRKAIGKLFLRWK